MSPARIIAVLALLGVGGFCVFGFLATYEPSTGNFVAWRTGYGVIGAAALVGAWLVLAGRRI